MSFAVLAGAAQVLWQPNAHTTLRAKTVGESRGVSSCAWRLARGPDGGSADISDENSLETTVTFDGGQGAYMFTCSVTDGAGNQAEGSMIVEVYAKESNFGGYPLAFLREAYEGDTLGTEYNFEGLDFRRCKPPPEPYQHPRVFMNPEDVPEMRRMLKETNVGQVLLKKIRNGLQKMKNQDAWKVAIGESEGELAVRNCPFVSLVVYEILDAVIEEDEERGRVAVGVLAKLADEMRPKLVQAKKHAIKMMKEKSRNPQRHRIDYRTNLQSIIQRTSFVYGYDFGYNFMTEKQRDACRRLMMIATTDIWCIGMEAPPSLDACRSNWVTHYDQILGLLLAVEGESTTDGKHSMDLGTFARAEASLERFCTFGINPDGSAYEGMGKNQVGMEIVHALSKRGFWPIASVALRNHISHYYAHHLFPFGTNRLMDKKHPDCCFTWDEALGGTAQESRYSDVAVYHAVFPNDPVLEVVYRAELQDSCSRLGDFNIRFPFKAMNFFTRSLYVMDPDTSQPFYKMYAEGMAGLPLTYFSDYQGRMVTQSSWHVNATQFHFQPRHIRGGHAHNDRNKFIFYGVGRTWLVDTGSNQNTSYLHNVVVIDDNDKKPGLLPAKTVAFADTQLATFAAGDARAAYALNAGDKVKYYVPFSLNDHRFERLNRPFYDIPVPLLPTWETGMHQKIGKRDAAHTVDYFPQYAYRTAGLVRGAYPYALIIDDIQMHADKECNYNFQLVISRELCAKEELRDKCVTIKGRDVHIVDPNNKKRCLIRFVDCSGEEPKYRWRESGYTLCCEVDALRPSFKVILYAYREGDPMPQTRLDNGTMRVEIGDQKDEFNLQEDEHGRNCFVLHRNGRKIFDINEHASPNGTRLHCPELVDMEKTPVDPRKVRAA